jgi:hypothetical protein
MGLSNFRDGIGSLEDRFVSVKNEFHNFRIKWMNKIIVHKFGDVIEEQST